MKKENITRITLEEARKLKSETDWEAFDALGEYEGPQEIEVDWDRAEWVEVPPKKQISVRLDADVLDFFKSQGKGYQTRINAVLRTYMEAKKTG